MGFMRDYPFERMMRDTRILSIFEGTNEILRLMIALSGLKAAGDRLKQLGRAAKKPFSDPLGLLSEAASRARNRLRPGALCSVHPVLHDCGEALRANTVRFGTAVEALLVAHGESVVHEQLQLRRVADVTIELYVTTAVLARASAALEAATPTAAHEAELARHFAALASRRVDSSLRELGGAEGAAEHDARVRSISRRIFDAGGYVARHPIGVD